jgi:DNA-binding transcriptional LysR family regulator
VKKIKNYSLDCGIFSDVPEDSALEIKQIFSDRLIFAQSAKSPVHKSNQIKPKDLEKIDFLSYPLRYELCYRNIERRFGKHLSKTRIVAESESFDTLKQMLVQGAGATFIPQYLIRDELRKGLITEIEINKVKLPIIFSFVTKRDADLSAATVALRNYLINWFAPV